jgi:hypothetical protein
MSTTPTVSPPPRRQLFVVSLLVSGAFVAGIGLAGLPRVSARPAEEAPPLLYRFSKNYLNFDKITHVIDEPGFNMPPGSLQVYFEGNQNWIALYGDEAEAFRHAVAQVTTDLTPKKAEPEKTEQAKTGTEKPKRRTISSPGGKGAGAGGGNSAAPPAKAAPPVVTDPGF